jgi:LacI family repressor for deo operon, udp, cdd, tsx, nupC, and nupG
MLWKRVDGVIVLATSLDEQEQAVIDNLGLPVVTNGNRIGRWSCVRIDDEKAMRIAVRHLLDLGHTEVAYVGARPDASAYPRIPQDRARAFAETLGAGGGSCRPEWMVESDWTAPGAARDIMPVLTGPSRPTAVVAASDEMALGVMGAARRLGLAIPGDLSVVGVDDHVLSGALGLTTVRQDVLYQGRRTGEVLMRQLTGEDVAVVDEVMPVRLIVRESTAPPARR